MFKLKLALKYALARRTTLLGVLGTMLSVAIMIIVVAVMSGFVMKIEDAFRGAYADVTVYDREGYRFPNDPRLSAKIGGVEGVERVTPVLIVPLGLMASEGPGGMSVKTARVIGVADLADVENGPMSASLKLETPADGETPEDWAVGGAELFDTPRVAAGDVIRIIVPRGGERRSEPAPFVVTGRFATGVSEIDDNFVMVPLARLQEMAVTGNTVNEILVTVAPGADVDATAARIAEALAPGGDVSESSWTVYTWRDSAGNVLKALLKQRETWIVILAIVLVVAGFTFTAIISMIVVEKTRDIGILRAVGASRSGVMGAFLVYGAAIGAVGAALGIAVSVVFLRYIDAVKDFLVTRTGWDPMPTGLFNLKSVPVEYVPWVWIAVPAVAVGVSLAASVYPAMRAARLDPVEALVHE